MKNATHVHKNKDFSSFKYRVANNQVFMLIASEWKRSTITIDELTPIHLNSTSGLNNQKRQPLIAKSVKTNRETLYSGIDEAEEKGFSKYAIKECLRRTRHTHKGCEWRTAL